MNWWSKSHTSGAGAYAGAYARACHKSHPPLELFGGTLTGGSASSPREADHLVLLDPMVRAPKGTRPWHGPRDVMFPITDFKAPSDPVEFAHLIDWIIARLGEARTVHVGCIGGHGRTGTVLAAVVARAGASDDPIGWVREHYCERAVESAAQVDFLVEHYGARRAKGAKSGVGYSAKGTKPAAVISYQPPPDAALLPPLSRSGEGYDTGAPARERESVWGDELLSSVDVTRLEDE